MRKIYFLAFFFGIVIGNCCFGMDFLNSVVLRRTPLPRTTTHLTPSIDPDVFDTLTSNPSANGAESTLYLPFCKSQIADLLIRGFVSSFITGSLIIVPSVSLGLALASRVTADSIQEFTVLASPIFLSILFGGVGSAILEKRLKAPSTNPDIAFLQRKQYNSYLIKSPHINSAWIKFLASPTSTALGALSAVLIFGIAPRLLYNKIKQ